jgi:archaeal flagellar protein FlaG
MAGTSTSSLVIFVASMMIAASVAGTLIDSVEDVSSSIGTESADVSENIRTDIEVISDENSPVYNTSGERNVTVLIKNTGERALRADANSTDVLIDGTYRTQLSMTELETRDGSWSRGEVVRLSVGAPTLPAGDHRLKLIAGGDEEVFSFRT